MENRNEIDLIELILKTYLIIKKYFWILIISISIAIIYTIVKNKIINKEYVSSMVLSLRPENNFMYAFTFNEKESRYKKNTGEIIERIISSLNSQILSKNTLNLSNKLNITQKDAENILSISSEYILNKDEAASSLFKINVIVKNTNVLYNLGEKIKNYINNNSYIKKQTKSDSLFLTSIISEIEPKIIELDKFHEKLIKDNNKINNITVLNNNSLFTESIQLISLKEKLKTEIKNLKKVEILEDFYISKKTNNSIKKDLIISTILMIFLGLFLIFLITLNKKANKFKKNH